GVLTLTSGNVATAANTLSIAAAGSITRTSGYIIGNLKKTYSAVGSFTYHVGTANGYSPVSSTITAGTGDLTVKAVQGAQPNLGSPQKALQRYWTLSGTGITTNLVFNYLQADVPGTANESLFVVLKYNGSFSQPPSQTVDTTANTGTVNGVNSFS